MTSSVGSRSTKGDAGDVASKNKTKKRKQQRKIVKLEDKGIGEDREREPTQLWIWHFKDP